VRKALAADPRERYQHVEDMLVDLRRTAGTPAVKPSRRQWLRVGAATATVIIITVLAGMDAGGLRTRLLGRMGGSARAVKLAILPFANMTGDPEQEYLSDGLTQEMISQLGSLHPANLSVIARTSVMRYKKSDKPVDEVGRELGVDYILEGSARREGNRIRITAELIQVRNQTQIWTETYEREVAGILALQSEVAKKVAGSLALKLLPAEQARLANVRQVNPEAYEAYLKGMQHWNRLTPADVETALQYFDLSIKKDPNYAPAHVGVYRVWTARRQMGRIPHKEAVAPATAAALKALELDENLAAVHEALAGMKSWQEWDWAGGELEYRRAIELDPSLADARAYYSHLLLVLQRPKEAMEQMQRAIELDPLNPLVQSLYAAELWRFRRYDEALVQAHNALRTAPGQPVATTALLAALHNKGMENELVAEMRASASLSGRREAIEAFERGYKEGGYRAGWKRYAEHIAAGFGRTHWSAVGAADSYAKAGKNALALDWLEKAFEAHDGNLPYVFVTPTYDQLRSEPRFQALRRKMNLPG
jgi:TolB-like protein